MAASMDNESSHAGTVFRENRASRTAQKLPEPVGVPERVARIAPGNAQSSNSPVQLRSDAVVALQERRRRRRAYVAPMYTQVTVRVIGQQGEIIEGHVCDLSETGMAVEMDSLVAVGQPVTVEFRVSGLGRVVDDQWIEIVAAAEVVRHDNVDDYPHGPYKVALRFVRMSTMAQAQISRFVALQG
jgi:c-di-GMP-binding flagellar brake protein YcgR